MLRDFRLQFVGLPSPYHIQLPTRNGVGPAAAGRRHRTEPGSRAASYARASSDLQRDNSIEFQQQACRKSANIEGKTIAHALEFEDNAISGTKLDRDGLNALLSAAEDGRFDSLFVESLSRISRETRIIMPILRRLVYRFSIRVVSVREALDTSRDDWEL